MKVLLTGANGYIGTRLIPVLLENGHELVCLVRDKRRFHQQSDYSDRVTIITGDLLKKDSIESFPQDIDAAYYLVHSMVDGQKFEEKEALSAHNFVDRINETHCKQIIYLSGMAAKGKLSRHLSSRQHMEEILGKSNAALTVLRASIIIGSGSASFEIVRDLAEKLPLMTAPKWVNTRVQPIAIRDVLAYLQGVLGREESHDRTFDIAGPDILTFKQLILLYAKCRNLKRRIIVVPFISPRLSSYWLYFVTSTSYSLAQNLVDSMKNESIAKDHSIEEIVPRKCLHYTEALALAFEKIEQNSIVSSWKDALNRGYLNTAFMDQIKVPQHGTMKYRVYRKFERDPDEVFANIWSIGGARGWYYWDWIWDLRGFIDKLFGGVGSRRGRTSGALIKAGDVLDFWRVLLADKEKRRLLLYAEMKIPGEAWLEFQLEEKEGSTALCQVATYRPNGVLGRMYWYAMFPFHLFIFNGMAKQIIHYQL
ncbi:MAG: SDR family oxidoreductase [Mucilaginibacter polytrichastri]|nr:SDR family oxidoreductase [Mucilaginibacter polytrichastri]